MDDKLTHIDNNGNANMVNVGHKSPTMRTAMAEGYVYVSEAVYKAIENDAIKKGNVLSIAQIAGIMGAKKTADIIPLCHPIGLDKILVELTLDLEKMAVHIVAKCALVAKTGVEMESLTAVATAALTIYDMCKALDKSISIGDIRLLEKTGGKSGDYRRK